MEFCENIKIYCISRNCSADRRRRMDRRFNNRGLMDSVVYIEAIEYIDPIVKKYRPDQDLTEFELKYAACFLSHLKALKIFLDSGEQSCIVCENDILIHNHFKERLKNTVESCPKDAPVICLGYFNGEDKYYEKVSASDSKEEIRNVGIDMIWGLQMYLISRKYAQACLFLFDREDFGCDRKTKLYPGLVVRNGVTPLITPEMITRKSVTGCFVVPPLAIEDCIMSEIAGKDRSRSHTQLLDRYNYSDYADGEPNESPLSYKIILATMVKNESKVIERMIKSAHPISDAVFVCDTGSSDNTLELAKKASGDLPYKEASVQWQDYSFNRTKTIELAREFSSSLGWDPKRTWLLLMDADQTLHMNGIEKKNLFGHDVVRIRQCGGSEDWINVRLVRASLPFKYVRRTHEYIDHPSSDIYDVCGVHIYEHSDGGCRSDKFIRDVNLLHMDLKDNPNDARSMFYLARTLRDMGDTHNAIKWYRRRILAGDFEEERWMAQLHLGRILIKKDVKLGRRELWKAFSERPWRSEPLFDLALSYMDNEQKMAYSVAQIGKSIPYPEGDILFIEKNLYRFEFDRILSITAYWCGLSNNGLKYSDYLRLLKDCWAHEEAIEHLIWYIQKIKSEWVKDVPIQGVENGWSSCNPSIIKHSDGYSVSVRTVNYKIDGDGRYVDFGEFVETRNFLIELDSELNPLSQVELESIKMSDSARVRNVEDVRLCKKNNEKIFGLGTRVDHEDNAMPRCFALEWDSITGKCLLNEEMIVSEKNHCEKNWLPFLAENEAVNILYSSSPLTIFEFKNESISLISKKDLDINSSGFRGSAAPVKWGNNWIYVIHETTSHRTDKKRTYIHRFCLMDECFNFIKCSEPFYFEEKGIEFCAGMALHEDGLILTYGINDARARMMFISGITVNEMLGIEKGG